MEMFDKTFWWLRKLWENPNQFILQYTSFDLHKKIIIEEIHVAGMPKRSITTQGSCNQLFSFEIL